MLYIVIHTKDHPNGELRGDSFVGMGGDELYLTLEMRLHRD
jgi:hypothetical protein